MSRFNVTNAVMDREQIEGTKSYNIRDTDNYIGDEIEAVDREEAVAIAISILMDSILNNGYDAEIENDEITVKDDEGNAIERYYAFTAK